MLPDVPVSKLHELLGTVKFPRKFNRPAPPDILISLVALADAVNDIPPLAFNSPEVITIRETREAVVLLPVNEIRPVTVAEPAFIFQESFLLLTLGCWKVTDPLTVRAAGPECVSALLFEGDANITPPTVASTFNVTVTPEFIVMISVSAGKPPGPVQLVHVPPESQLPVALALQVVGAKVVVLPKFNQAVLMLAWLTALT
jgi:hypothetical protein